jgi:ABC-type sugar transport system substrate-binding protein
MGNKYVRIICMVLVCMLTAALFAACANAPAAQPDNSKTAESSAAAPSASSAAPSGAGSNLIVYTQKTLDQFFHVALQDKLSEAVTAAGFQVEITNCNNDSAVQVTQMENTITKTPKAIIANSVDSDGFNDAVKKAVDAKIPVIEVDNPASTAVVDGIVAFDNYKLGAMAAEEIVSRLTKKYGAEKGMLVDVYGAMSSECWRLRKQGFDETMKKHPGVTVVETPGEGEQAKSQDALTNIIAKYGDKIDAVFCPSDAPGIGCAEALKVANMWHPISDAKHVIFVTGDGEPSAVTGIRDGYYDCTVVEDAYAYGPIAVDLLVNYVFKGQTVPTTGTYTNEKFFWKTAEFTKSDRGPVLMMPPYVMDASNIDKDGHWGVAALKAAG